MKRNALAILAVGFFLATGAFAAEDIQFEERRKPDDVACSVFLQTSKEVVARLGTVTAAQIYKNTSVFVGTYDKPFVALLDSENHTYRQYSLSAVGLGGRPRTLTHRVQFSPDSRYFAYTVYMNDRGNNFDAYLIVLDLETMKLRGYPIAENISPALEAKFDIEFDGDHAPEKLSFTYGVQTGRFFKNDIYEHKIIDLKNGLRIKLNQLN